MLDTLITSKTRKKLLLKFFLNSASFTYLRNLEQELDESPNALRIELAKFEKANMLLSSMDGKKKMYRVNEKHPLFQDIHNIILKTIGFDQIIDKVLTKLWGLEMVYLTGSYANGISSNIIDLLLVGKNINTDYLIKLIDKTEKLINKRIRYLIISIEQMNDYIGNNDDCLLLWANK